MNYRRKYGMGGSKNYAKKQAADAVTSFMIKLR